MCQAIEMGKSLGATFWIDTYMNLGLVTALILATGYSGATWIPYDELVECGYDGQFWTQFALVAQCGLIGVLYSVLMVINVNAVRKGEDGESEGLRAIFWMNVFGFCVVSVCLIIVGTCIMLMNESVHRCQFINAYPDEELPSLTIRGGIHGIDFIGWGFFGYLDSLLFVTRYEQEC